MRIGYPFAFLTGLLASVSFLPAQATTRPATSRPAELSPPDRLAVTEHRLSLPGQVLSYKATAGYLPVKDETGRDKANFFFVAYDKADSDRATRPITFVFNGGPGAASVWLHLGTVGPRRIAWKNDLGEAPALPYRLLDNEGTWLDASDLVFIDPVGTGYSRAAPGEKRENFHGVKQDVASVGEFIRLYITRYQRWASPKFLAGESYGTTRAAALSEHLLDRYGIALNGILLISTVLDFQTLQPGRSNDLACALFLPTYTAAAAHYRKLPAELQQDLPRTLKQVEQFALGDYLLALAHGATLPADRRKAIASRLAEFTGLPASVVDKANLRISPDLFRKMLLEDRREILGRFDARITGFALEPAASWTEYDPSLSAFLAAYSAAFNAYVRAELKYENDLPYEVLTDKVHPWDFGRERGYLNVTDELRSTIAKTPNLKLFFASGDYDLATPWFATDYTINHLDLGPARARNIQHIRYPGGHMLYHNRDVLLKLGQDARAFITNTARPQ